MICSMTAYGSARVESDAGSVTIEVRSVNNRFLDLGFRLPEDLRVLEAPVREQLSAIVARGKVEFRLTYALARPRTVRTLDQEVLRQTAEQLAQARQFLPDTPSPRLDELLHASAGSGETPPMFLPEIWVPMCLEATAQALSELQANRLREGRRLADAMLAQAGEISAIVAQVEEKQAELLAEHQEKIRRKLHDALLAVSPEGFAQISGQELSARVAHEASLFSLRVDIAEELTRLRSHVQELQLLLTEAPAQDIPAKSGNQAGRSGKPSGSIGKRLDFLFQEMNREANTLGSKSASVLVTGAAIDLKLLIEQLREQAANLE